MTTLDPPETLSDAVARNIQEARKRRGMSAADLAEACARAGFPELTASVIANIESGRRDEQGRRRRTVTVDEVYAFSQALGVGVTMLLPPPPGRDEGRWRMLDRLDEVAATSRRQQADLAKQEEALLADLDPAGLWAEYRTWLLVDADQPPRTVHAYRQIIRAWLGYLEGLEPPKPWQKATKRDLTRFLDRLPADTRSRYAEVVKGLYTFAFAAGLIRKNPLGAVRLPQVKTPRSLEPADG
jgi:transcriptional regulator with XRE-family HTH domain